MDATDKDKSAVMLPHNCMDGGTIMDAASGNVEIILRQITWGTFTDAQCLSPHLY
jgi:hypothetical protein